MCCVSCGGSFGDCVLHHQVCSMPLFDISAAICQFMPLFRHFFSYLPVYAFVQTFLQLFASLCLCSDISSVICQFMPLFRYFFSYLSVYAFVRHFFSYLPVYAFVQIFLQLFVSVLVCQLRQRLLYASHHLLYVPCCGSAGSKWANSYVVIKLRLLNSSVRR